MPMLTDMVVLVTGAAQGIGACIAKTLAADGATLFLADIQEGLVARVAAGLVTRGVRASSVAVDIGDPRLVEQMIDAGLREFGRIDALVNNAGMDAPPGLAWEVDEASWRRVIDV